MPLTHVTFTGADHTVDLLDLRSFLADYAAGTIEIAVLASVSRAGEDRYPLPEQAAVILETARKVGQRTAVHLCGRMAAAALIDFDRFVSEHTAWCDLSATVDRVQVNVPPRTWGVGVDDAPLTTEAVAASLANALDVFQVIVQTREAAFPPKPAGRVTYLFDRSGGRGQTPGAWPQLPERQYVGYAGGLSDDNVAEALRAIAGSGEGNFWIDMETGIREPIYHRPAVLQRGGPSYLSFTRCRLVMQAAAPYFDGGRVIMARPVKSEASR